MADADMAIPQHALQRVQLEYAANWRSEKSQPVVVSSGFSGGMVWRLECPSGFAALRCWPAGYPAVRLAAVHRVQSAAHANGCKVVPLPIPNCAGSTYLLRDNYLWDLCTWMPGEPAPNFELDDSLLVAAIDAVVSWHRAIAGNLTQADLHQFGEAESVRAAIAQHECPSPGIARRWSEWQRLTALVTSFRHWPLELADLANRMLVVVRRFANFADSRRKWQSLPVRMRLCLRDVHREHVLFTGQRVSGLVDFGAVGLDTIACDLARLLGDTIPDQPARWPMAIAYCRRSIAMIDDEVRLIDDFHILGTLIGALHWLEWLAIERRSFDNPSAAYRRLEALVRRLERLAVAT